jgi:hypothetical protein
VTPPKVLHRVEWTQGYGFPEVYKWEQTHRTYDTAGDAQRQVAHLFAMPSHHRNVRAWFTQVTWAEVPDTWMPRPPEHPPESPETVAAIHAYYGQHRVNGTDSGD